MIKYSKLFVLVWKTLLIIVVYFLTFTFANLAIKSYQSIATASSVENSALNNKLLVVGDSNLHILLANTDELRIKGLSGHAPLDDDQGMLFTFDSSDYYGIWMKDMNFAIDIIWIDDKLQVVDLAENVEPSTYPKVFKPKKKAKYVLEVNSGYIKKNGVKFEDQLTFLN